MKHSLHIFIFLLISTCSFAQIANDCDILINVCGNDNISGVIGGPGDFDFPGNTSGCLSTNAERNSVWFRVRIQDGTQFGFDIVPVTQGNDYDFAVYGPDVDCDNLGEPIRCSYYGTPVAPYWNTGVGGNETTLTDFSEPASGGGVIPGYTYWMDVNPGEEYIILVNNFSTSNDGFNLRWTSPSNDLNLDCSIVVGNLGPDIEVCSGEEVVLDGASTDPNVTYTWALDTTPFDGNDNFTPITGETDPTLTISNSQTGIYQVIYDNGSVTDTDEIIVEFVDPPNIAMDNVEECGAGGEAQFDFDQIIADFEAANADVELELYEVDPEANPSATPITGTYTNTTTPQTIYALQTVDPGCSTVITFELSVLEEPNIVMNDVEECGLNNEAEFDFDEIITNFETANPTITIDLYDVDPEVNPSATPITGTYTNTSNPQTIYALQTDANNGCENVIQFQLVVIEANPVTMDDQEQCSDSDTANFDFDQIISDFETANPDYTISLHLNQPDAEATPGNNPQTGIYANTSNPQTIYARQEFTATGCISVVEFDLIVNQNPNITINDVEECGLNDEAEFDFDAIISDFESSNTGIDLVLYDVDPEANPGATPIIGTYTNTSNPQTIWAQQTNTNTSCANVLTFDLIVNDTPQITMNDVEECGINDEAVFDFDQIITDFEAANADVELELFDVDPESNPSATPITGTYTNTSNPQTIYAQQSDVNTNCTSVQTFELIVNNAPNVALNNVEECGVNDEAVFDLDAIITTFETNNPNTSIELFEEDPETNPSATPITGSYTNTSNPQTVYAQQTDDTNLCSSVVEFQLIVNNEPEIAMPDLEVCGEGGQAEFDFDTIISDFEASNPGITLALYDVDPEANPGATPIIGMYTNTSNPQTIYALQSVSATNCTSVMTFTLIANQASALPTASLENCPAPATDDATMAEFTLSDADAQIDAGNSGYSITYYETQADIVAGNALPNTYMSATTTIFAVATGGDLDCPSQTEVQLTVLPFPEAFDVEDQQCSPTDEAEFDLSLLVDQIRNNDTSLDVSFFETFTDATNGSPEIPTSYETVTTTVFARVDNGTCFDITEVNLIVTDAVPLPTETIEECDSGDGSASFDLNAFVVATENEIDAEVQFYDSYNGAENQIAADELNGTLQTTTRVVYLRVEENGVDCTTIRDIDLIVNENPPVLTDFVIQNCELSDTNNDFYLDETELEEFYTYELYETASLAQTGDESTAIVEPYSSTGDEFIFLRTENPETGCYSVSEVYLEIIEIVERTLEPIEVCYGEEFLLPDGRRIRDSGNFVVENPINCTLDYYTLNFVVCDTDYCKPLIPSGFTPNADAVNSSIELIEPWGCTIAVQSIKIFNRWGEVVYEAAGNDFNWQGQYADGQLAQQGIYIYHVEYEFITNTGEEGTNNVSGTINLIR